MSDYPRWGEVGTEPATDVLPVVVPDEAPVQQEELPPVPPPTHDSWDAPAPDSDPTQTLYDEGMAQIAATFAAGTAEYMAIYTAHHDWES